MVGGRAVVGVLSILLLLYSRAFFFDLLRCKELSYFVAVYKDKASMSRTHRTPSKFSRSSTVVDGSRVAGVNAVHE